jgi:hypothetical protein
MCCLVDPVGENVAFDADTPPSVTFSVAAFLQFPWNDRRHLD